MAASSEFVPYLEMAQGEADRAQQQVEAAQQQLDQAQQTRKFWLDLGKCLDDGHSAHGLLLLRREAEFCRGLQAADEALVQRLRRLYTELERQSRASAASFGRDFPPRARDAGIKIDSTSRHPKYTFNEGFLRLEVDERNLTAKIVPRDGEEMLLGLDTALIVERIRSEQARLFDRDVDSSTLLRSLYTAYVAVLRAEGRNDSEEVPLRRIANRLAKNLNRFAHDEFNVDLSRLVQRGELTVDGRRLHLNHTRNRRQGMLLHGLESGGFVGFVSFKSEKVVTT